ncbi:MAG TPA: apolipoprotein N-acyltransferase [Rectinemataceae bacterium]|nr:apolipoprotein N-acyltransferase [Rectinemataceae bacterium]
MQDLFLLPLFSAVLCAISLPNDIFLAGLWPLGFLSLIPFYITLRRAASPRRAAIAGAVFGGMHHALTSYWLFFYKGFAFWTLGTTTIAYAVVYATIGLYGSFLLRSETKAYRPFLFALGWTVFEFLKSTGFLGYPWGLVPYSLTSAPVFLQIADSTGVYGLSFILALSAAVLSELFVLKNQKTHSGLSRQSESPLLAGKAAAFAALLIALTLGYGLVAMNTDIPVKAVLRAILVQQNTDPWISGEYAALESNVSLARKAFDENAAAGGRRADLMVFSETSLRRPFGDYRDWFATHPQKDPLLPMLAETDSYLLTGAPVVLDWDTYAATNSVIFISPEGQLIKSYAKIHPVPFAEAIPLWEYEWFRKFMREVIGIDSGWVMGSELTVFSIPLKSAAGDVQRIDFSTPICFEDAFADLCRQYFLKGADLLINLTNDSWSTKKSAQIQHWAIARFRAIENRRTLVRSTNSGVSCVVDPWGKMLFEMPQFENFSAAVDIPIFELPKLTIYTAYGDWFALVCALLFSSRVIINCIKFRKSLAV